MCQHRKRPYKKPAITVISVDSPRYNELMQSLSQELENADAYKQADDSKEKEEGAHV